MRPTRPGVLLWTAALPSLLLLLMAGLAVRRPAVTVEPIRPGALSAARVESPFTRRILLIILDAWRRKVALDDDRMPRLAQLARRGSRGTVFTGPRTFTKACVREMMTGRVSTLRDSTLNLMKDPVTEQSLLTRMNEAHLRFTLIDLIGDLPELFERQSPPGSIRTLSSAGLPLDPPDPAHDALAETAGVEALGDSRQVLVMIHLESLDLAGHIYLPDTPSYERALRAADDRIGRLVGRLDLERDTLLVIGDHGSDDMGHHGGPDRQARETAYLAAGAGIRHGQTPLEPLDVADSLAALLGLCPPDQSIGAPQPDLLAIEPGLLKARCDRCLRDRLAAGSREAASAEASQYFAASTFSPQVAALYKQAVASRRGERWPAAALLLAGAAILLGLMLLYRCVDPLSPRTAWTVPAVILLLSLSMQRDLVALLLYAAILLLLAFWERNARGALALAAAIVLVVGATAALPGADQGPRARALAEGVFILAGVVLAPRAFRASRAGRLAPLVLTSLGAAAAAGLIRSDQTPGRFSLGVTLVDYALGSGILFLLVGLLLRENSLSGLAALALGACFFHGWPLAVFVLLTTLLILSPRRLPPTLSLPAALGMSLGALALLCAENGGYGFSRIDLSLSVLGVQWADTPGYGWGATVILFSYLLPLILAARVGASFGAAPRPPFDAIPAAFLLFAGVDLAFLALPGISLFPRARLEEVFVFDVVLALLALLWLGVDRASEHLARPAVATGEAGRSVSPEPLSLKAPGQSFSRSSTNL